MAYALEVAAVSHLDGRVVPVARAMPDDLQPPGPGGPPSVRRAGRFQEDAEGRPHRLEMGHVESLLTGQVVREVSATEPTFITSYAFDAEGTLGAAKQDWYGSAVLTATAPDGTGTVWRSADLSHPSGIGAVFRGADGAAYVTATYPGWASLFRVGTSGVTPVMSWIGAPEGLAVAPLEVDGGLVFLQNGALLLMPDAGEPPVAHVVDFGCDDAVASDGALWLIAGPQDDPSARDRVVWWMPFIYSDPLVLTGEVVQRIVPLSKREAVVTVSTTGDLPTSRSFRLTSWGSVTPLDLPGGAWVIGGSFLR
jgi:hypothetical protein